jgi:RNA polymerase sigma-54 factor
MLTHVQVTSTRPVTTAHLAQTMTLLSLPIDELAEQIETELSNNPALEMLEERHCPTCHRPLPDKGLCPICSRPANVNSEEPVVFISTREDFYPQGEPVSEDYPDEPISPSVEDLPTYVMRQIATELKDGERGIAAYLLTHLNEDGLLTTTLYDAASYLHVPVSRVEAIQSIIKRADPIGVGSFTPQEALLVQLDVLSETEYVPDLVIPIVRDNFDLLTRHHFADLAKIYDTPIRQIQKLAKYISENLNPFPARSHWGNIRQPGLSDEQVYRQPDIIINHMNEDPSERLMVEIIIPLRGTLRVNPLFKAAISETEEQTK